MKKLSALFLLFVVFPAFVFAQALDEKLQEIDAYAEQVMTDWKGPGMAISRTTRSCFKKATEFATRQTGQG